MKITVGTKDGKTHQIETEENSKLIGKKIGESFDGGIIGLNGYELEITGGTDRDGFPMRQGIKGTERSRRLLKEGQGIRIEEKGDRRRRSVRGNTVSGQIEQLNTQVVEEGSQTIEELLSEDEE